MPYKVLLADIDGTLFDFRKGEEIAIAQTFSHFSIPATPDNLAAYHAANNALWKLLEQGGTTQAQLRVQRFVDFLAATGLDADPNAMSEDYILTLGAQCHPLPGAVDLCRAVSARMPIYLVTNGISRIQRSRLAASPIVPYVAGMVVSEDIGAAKPDPAMLFEALRMAGLAPDDAILLGDSPTADVAAANRAGIRSILFTNGAPAPDPCPATFACATLPQACDIILN